VITTVAIITRLRLYQELLSSIVGSRPGFAVIAISASEAQAIEAVSAQLPDIALIDAALPGVWEVTRAARGCSVRVVLFGLPDKPETVASAERAGCEAILVSTATSREVIISLERVRCHAGRPIERTIDDTPVATLTSRELEVLGLVAQGLSNKEIAGRLTVSLPTVKTHVHNVLFKLGAHRRADAGRLLHLASTTAVSDQATGESTATSAVSEPRPLRASLG
jgi:DNA-binding NarL/FixJ family response regulator